MITRPRRPEAGDPLSNAGQVIALQQTAGNAATARYLSRVRTLARDDLPAEYGDTTSLSDAELAAELQSTRAWLAAHGSPELDYYAMLAYAQRLEAEAGKRGKGAPALGPVVPIVAGGAIEIAGGATELPGIEGGKFGSNFEHQLKFAGKDVSGHYVSELEGLEVGKRVIQVETGALEVGGEVVGEDLVLATVTEEVTGTALATAGLRILGGIVLAGAVIYLVVKIIGADEEWTEPDAPVEATLPGEDIGDAGVGEPPAGVAEPAEAPGESDAPICLPGETDEPAELAATPHDHHVFPKQFKTEFGRIGIWYHRWTISLPAEQHLKLVHGEQGWNLEWQEWLEEHLPDRDLTREEASKLRDLARAKAIEMLEELGINSDELHYYRKKGKPGVYESTAPEDDLLPAPKP